MKESDLELLSALLAVQLDFIDRGALIHALKLWPQAPRRTLREIIVAEQFMTSDYISLLS